MRRLALIVALALGCGVGLTACGPGQEATPLPETVVGPLQDTGPKGDPAKGKAVYEGNGCGGCHTFTAAGSKGTIGPNLDNLAKDAEQADHGTVQDYARESLLNPNAYVVPGFKEPSAMPAYTGLSPQQLADLVAYLTQKS